jgi:hypothetical protein
VELPNFLIIGAMKSATSSLRAYLQEHPQVFVPAQDELHFFVEEHNWSRGLDWYRAQFAAADGAHAVGEKSPTYTMYPVFQGVPDRIAKVLPDVRLVYVVRHPVERMRSQYQHFLATGNERRPIEEALVVGSDYHLYSCYATQVEQYVEHFDRDRLLVITTEDLRERREDTVRRVLAFLDLDTTWTPPNLDREAHRTGEKRVSPALLSRARRMSGYQRMVRLVPSGLRGAVVRAASRPFDPAETVVPPDLARSLEESFRPEVARLRSYLPPDWNGWGIS